MESDALGDPRLDSGVHSLTNSGIKHPLSGFFIGNTDILGFHWSFVYSCDWFSGKVKLEKQGFQCLVKHQDVLSLNSSESRKEEMFCWPWSGRDGTEGNGSCLGLEGWLGRTSAVRGDEAMGSSQGAAQGWQWSHEACVAFPLHGELNSLFIPRETTACTHKCILHFIIDWLITSVGLLSAQGYASPK